LLHRELVQIIAQPDMKARLATLGYEPLANTPEEFAEQIKAEFDVYKKVVDTQRLKLD
jgi:tripartite-type tricarboxylate transporter receptor subunit TctC